MTLALIIISAFFLILIAFLLFRNHQNKSQSQEMLIDKYGLLISNLSKESSAKIIKSEKHEVLINSVQKGTVWTYHIRENNKGLLVEHTYNGGFLGKYTRNWHFSGDETEELMLEEIASERQKLFTKMLFNQ